MCPQRTYEWEDPQVVIDKVVMSGSKDPLALLSSGEMPLPPAGETLGLRLSSVSHKEAVMKCAIEQWHCNTAGIVNGGLISAMADNVLGLAMLTVTPPEHRQTTVDLHIRFFKPVPITVGDIIITAKVTHSGKRVGSAACEITDSSGTLFATATCSSFFYTSAPRA